MKIVGNVLTIIMSFISIAFCSSGWYPTSPGGNANADDIVISSIQTNTHECLIIVYDNSGNSYTYSWGAVGSGTQITDNAKTVMAMLLAAKTAGSKARLYLMDLETKVSGKYQFSSFRELAVEN